MTDVLALDVLQRVAGFALEARLEAAGTLAVLGPNGAGKSTLLLATLGALRPERGRVVLGERVLFDAGAGVELPMERRGFGYVPQSAVLLPQLTALGNLELACELRGLHASRSERRQHARAWLARLEAEGLAEREPARLSGGERQRVALARALASGPKALLLDEPLAALDADARVRVRELLADALRELALPTLLVTHDRRDAEALASSAIVLERGRIAQQGALAAVLGNPATPFLATLAS